MLELTARRAFIVSLQANVLSTILGVVIAFAVDMVLVSLTDSSGYEPTKTATSMMLVPMFAITWCVEYFAVARLARDKGRRQVLRTTGWANRSPTQGCLRSLGVLPRALELPAQGGGL
jgi:ABC-type polysaccharide transport system permease subunit